MCFLILGCWTMYVRSENYQLDWYILLIPIYIYILSYYFTYCLVRSHDVDEVLNQVMNVNFTF